MTTETLACVVSSPHVCHRRCIYICGRVLPYSAGVVQVECSRCHVIAMAAADRCLDHDTYSRVDQDWDSQDRDSFA